MLLLISYGYIYVVIKMRVNAKMNYNEMDPFVHIDICVIFCYKNVKTF